MHILLAALLNFLFGVVVFWLFCFMLRFGLLVTSLLLVWTQCCLCVRVALMLCCLTVVWCLLVGVCFACCGLSCFTVLSFAGFTLTCCYFMLFYAFGFAAFGFS